MTGKKKANKKELENYRKVPVNQNDKDVDPDPEEVPPAFEDEDQTCEERIAELEKQFNEQKDKFLRLRADFENYRKRAYKDMMGAREDAKVDAVYPLLNVLDHFDMAVNASETADNMDAIRDGLKMILGEFKKALDELGLEKIDAVGEEFDPNLHEAVGEEPSDEYEQGVVMKQWRGGYRMGDKVIRPANVIVSSGPEKAESEE